MVATGFLPSKLFETEVPAERIEASLKRMQDDVALEGDEGIDLLRRIDCSKLRELQLIVLSRLLKEKGFDLQKLMDESVTVTEAVLNWFSDEVNSVLRLPAGIGDETCKDVCEAARISTAGNRKLTFDQIFDYPDMFLRWVTDLIKRLADRLVEGKSVTHVSVSVPNVDIPIEGGADAVIVFGDRHLYGGGVHTYVLTIPWYGRHVVRRDYLAYARLLLVALMRELPDKIRED